MVIFSYVRAYLRNACSTAGEDQYFRRYFNMKETVKKAIAAIAAVTLLSAAAIPVVGWAMDQYVPTLYTCADDDWTTDDLRW